MNESASSAPAKAPPRSWYLLGILVLIYVMGSIDRAVPSLIVEPIKREFGVSDGQIGLLTGFAYSLPYALAVLPGGWLIDRFHRVRLLSLTTLVWSVLTMAGGIATSFAMLIVARIGVGAAEAPASPGSLSLIGDSFPPQRRGTAIGIYYAGTAFGMLVTFLVGGWLLMHFGWRTVFFLAGVPGLILAVLLLTTCREPLRGRFDRTERDIAQPKVSYAAAFAELRRSPPLRHSIAGMMLATGVQFSVMVWTVSFLIRIHGLANETAAIWVGLGIGLLQTVGSLIGGPLADKVSRGDPGRFALVPAVATFGAGATGVAMALAPGMAASVAFMGIFGVFVGCAIGPGYATVVGFTPAHIRGSMLSIAKLISILIGSGALTFFTGTLSDAIGGNDSIRWALAATLLFHFWAAFHFWSAWRTGRAPLHPA